MTPKGEAALAVILDAKNERIAALEAELAVELQKRRNLLDSFNEQMARAEKAEAEVERLRGVYVCPCGRRFSSERGLHKHTGTYPNHLYEGGGRESGGHAGAGKIPGRPDTAANPAAPSGVTASPPHIHEPEKRCWCGYVKEHFAGPQDRRESSAAAKPRAAERPAEAAALLTCEFKGCDYKDGKPYSGTRKGLSQHWRRHLSAEARHRAAARKEAQG